MTYLIQRFIKIVFVYPTFPDLRRFLPKDLNLPEKNSFQAGKTDMLFVNNTHTSWYGPPSIENSVWRLLSSSVQVKFSASPIGN